MHSRHLQDEQQAGRRRGAVEWATLEGAGNWRTRCGCCACDARCRAGTCTGQQKVAAAQDMGTSRWKGGCREERCDAMRCRLGGCSARELQQRGWGCRAGYPLVGSTAQCGVTAMHRCEVSRVCCAGVCAALAGCCTGGCSEGLAAPWGTASEHVKHQVRPLPRGVCDSYDSSAIPLRQTCCNMLPLGCRDWSRSLPHLSPCAHMQWQRLSRVPLPAF